MCERIAEESVSATHAFNQTKNKFEGHHVLNYLRDYIRPIVDIRGAAMPYEGENWNVVLGDDPKPKLDEIKLDVQDDASPGSKDNWQNLIKLDVLCKPVTETIESTTTEQRRRMQKMGERCQDVAKRQRERYSAQRGAHMRQKETKEKHGMESNLFKNQVLHAGLVIGQQNPSNFHGFTTVVGAIAGEPGSEP